MQVDLTTTSGMVTQIRPGIYRPDWSVLTKPAACAALKGRNRSRSGLCEKWSQPLEATQDLVWRTVLELFATFGRPPHLAEIGREIDFSEENIRMLVADLQGHDLLATDKSANMIVYAYPFTAHDTEHRVELRGREIHAVCAIDALGVAGMLRTDAAIESSCRACGTRIEIGTAQAGKSLDYGRPGDAVVWYDLAYSESATASCCPSIAFFCSDADLQRWLIAQSSQREGYRLTLDEALEVGRALFEPVLATAKPS